MIKDKLQIFIITYNREFYLKRTFEQIFAQNSPIKDFDITILDNKSTDGTYKLIEEYRKKFPNIKCMIHNRNIGGNANIARAFELASKKYVWVLCDDDFYNWDNWSEVEKAVNEDYDAVVTALYNITNKNNISDVIFQLVFLPAGIYKVSNINDNVMKNIYDNLQNIFPHLVLPIYLVNNNKKIYVLNKEIITEGYEYANSHEHIDKSDNSLIRGYDKDELFAVTQNMNWHIGYVNTLTLMNDKKAVMNGLKSAMTYKPLKTNIFDVVRCVVYNSMRNKKSYNLYYDFFSRVNMPVKLLMIYYRYFPFCFYKTEKSINIQICNKLKFKLIPNIWRRKQK